MTRAVPVDDGLTGVDVASTSVTVERAITAVAGVLTVLLTAAAFWLSYEHLQEVAASHGMAQAVARSWAWPATVDLFIVIGELLILRASLVHTVDWWAIGLVIAGDGGSIALNVAGVGDNARPLDYVVSAVPPVAALLAFGALMRQVHAYLARHTRAAVDAPLTGVDPISTPVEASVYDLPAGASAAPSRSTGEAPVRPALAAPVDAPSTPVAPDPVPVDVQSTAVDLCMPVIYPNRVDQLVRALYGTDFRQPSTARMTQAMSAAGLGGSESTARTARSRVKVREPYLTALPAGIAS
ncbi:DUF2637 domain-containing protein [Streptomyces sp. NPDC051994]|uniref:DUF2637 domain-containing protein n=1 Tax=unclassified Streptomyces TaxID=2593676 RepID=UPI00343CF809